MNSGTQLVEVRTYQLTNSNFGKYNTAAQHQNASSTNPTIQT